MKFYFLALLFLASVAQAAPHETVCGGQALETTQALIKINNKSIVALSQDASSMKLVDSLYQDEGSFELWEISLVVQEGGGASYRSTVVRSRVGIDFGKDGRVACTVQEMSLPFAN